MEQATSLRQQVPSENCAEISAHQNKEQKGPNLQSSHQNGDLNMYKKLFNITNVEEKKTMMKLETSSFTFIKNLMNDPSRM